MKTYHLDGQDWSAGDRFPICDDDGMVRGGYWHFGIDYPCSGSAHVGGHLVECSNPIHRTIEGFLMEPMSQPDPDGLVVQAVLGFTEREAKDG